MNKGNVEFVGGPKCGAVARGYVVTYRRRDAEPNVSAGGNRMYDFERVASA